MDNSSRKKSQNNSGAPDKKSSQNLKESNSYLSSQEKISKKEGSLYTNEGDESSEIEANRSPEIEDGGQPEIEADGPPENRMIEN